MSVAKRVRELPKLPLAPPPPEREVSEKEAEALQKYKERTLRELRIFLREVCVCGCVCVCGG